MVWDLDDRGRLARVLPNTAVAAIGNAFQELSAALYIPALPLFDAARDAYDERPRRDRDACSNAFDAMESAAKIKNNMPHATFGQVVAAIEPTNVYQADTIALLRSLNNLRNHHFGHGMTTPFVLAPHEVDLTYPKLYRRDSAVHKNALASAGSIPRSIDPGNDGKSRVQIEISGRRQKNGKVFGFSALRRKALQFKDLRNRLGSCPTLSAIPIPPISSIFRRQTARTVFSWPRSLANVECAWILRPFEEHTKGYERPIQ